MKEFIAPAASFVIAMLTGAFGYGKLKQKSDDSKKEFDRFISTNTEDHRIFFGELSKITKHMGAVEKYMEMSEKRRNGEGN